MCIRDSCYPDRKYSFTVANELHEPMSFCVYFVSSKFFRKPIYFSICFRKNLFRVTSATVQLLNVFHTLKTEDMTRNMVSLFRELSVVLNLVT